MTGSPKPAAQRLAIAALLCGVLLAGLAAPAPVAAQAAEGFCVAVATNGTNRVATSADGLSWSLFSAAQANVWRDVAYSPDAAIWAAVASTGTNRVMTSEDGESWTARAAAEANGWVSIAYGNGRFVAVSSDGTSRAMTSDNGVDWTARSIEALSWNDVAFGNGLFVAVAGDAQANSIATSPDGITWTTRSQPSQGGFFVQLSTVGFGGGVFAAAALGDNSPGGTDRVLTSSSGVTWTQRDDNNENAWGEMAYGNGIFAGLLTTGHNAMYSDDSGASWSQATGLTGTPGALAHNGARFVAATGTTFASSENGQTWDSRTATTQTWGGIGCHTVAAAAFEGEATVLVVLLDSIRSIFGVDEDTGNQILGLILLAAILFFASKAGALAMVAALVAGSAALFKLGLLELWVVIVIALFALALVAKRLG